jgi:hypothetical protein
MHQNCETSQPEALDNSSLQTSEKVQPDLLVLQYMAQRVCTHLLTLASHIPLPSVHHIEEEYNRRHRVVIYNRPEILLQKKLMFVGFVSGLREHISLETVQELYRVDKLLIAELVNHPGLLSYSSLELHESHWYNLVLLSDSSAKTYFGQNDTHRYAAYQLAPHYYTWIRLHSGTILRELGYDTMIVHSTKYYIFPEAGQKPIRQEVRYDKEEQ